MLALIRVGRARGWKPGLAGAALLVAALLVPIVPWTVRNQVVLDRTVPISTGGGKALYVGTFLPADGEYQRVKAMLVRRYLHRDLDPHSEALEDVDPTPLFDRVAERYPDLPRDSALGKIGKQNFSHYFGEDPVGYVAMTARKTWRMWSAGIGEAMSSTAGRVVQTLIVALALAGLGVLAWRRRWWELVGDGDAARARHRGRRRLAGRPPPQRGADDAGLSACRRGALAGDRRPIVQAVMAPVRRHLPRRADRAAQRRADRRGRARRLRGRCAGARCATSTC